MNSLFQGVCLKRFLITFLLFHILCLAHGPLAFLIKYWSWSLHLSLSLSFGSQLLDLDKTSFVPYAFLEFICLVPRLSLELFTPHSAPSSPSWGYASLELKDPISFELGSPPFSELLCFFILPFITRPLFFMFSLSYWAELPSRLGPKLSLLFPMNWAFFVSMGLAPCHILDLKTMITSWIQFCTKTRILGLMVHLTTIIGL